MKTKTKPYTPPKRGVFYDRKVIESGFSRLLAFTKILPDDWKYVRIHVTQKSNDMVKVIIEKLLGEEVAASSAKTDKAGE